MSFFASVEMAPGDPILGLTETYVADPRPGKINLGVGIYVDEQGRIPLLPSVREVEQALAAAAKPRGYLPIDGMPAYNQATQQLVFGAGSPLLAAGRVATVQTVGGSGALRGGVDLGKLEPGTVVLLHACCHNPTGVDLDAAQWQQVIALLRERRLLPFVDMAYQGFAQGTDADAAGVRLLASSGIEAFVVANSYSKSFSLYGERVGALSMVGADRDEAARLLSKIKQTIRANYSSPSTHGAALVAGVLGSAELHARWEQELGGMRERIHAMRAGFVERLAAHGAPDFGFINRQAGMFSYSGLSKAQVHRLRDEHAIYALDSGRICVAALNQANLDTVAAAVAAVIR